MPKPPPPAALKVALQDYVSTFAGVIGIVLIIIALIFYFQAEERYRATGYWEVMAIVVGLIIVCGLVLVWRLPRRIRYIHDKWNRGIMSEATLLAVKDVGTGSSRHRTLHYRYEYQGKTYQKKSSVGRHWQPPGNALPIIIDPEDPDKSLLTNLF